MVHWRIDFSACEAFSSDGDAQLAVVLFNLTKDGQNLERWAAEVKVPSSAGNLGPAFMEVAPPRFLGRERPTPKIPHAPYREAVVAYMVQMLWHLDDDPTDPKAAFQRPWTAEFEADATDDAAW